MKNKDYSLYNSPANKNLYAMLENNAKMLPDKVGIRQRAGRNEIESITYAQLFEDVKRVAAFISETYGRDKHIAILGENSYEWLLAFLATVISGNVAVPTDKEQPAGEIKKLFEAADVSIAFVSKNYSHCLSELDNKHSMTLKQLREVQPEGFEYYEPNELEMDELTTIFFTSGTMGQSKGVMLSHRNIIEEINNACKMINPEGDSTVAVLPFNHAFGLIVSVLASINYQCTVFITKSLKSVQKDILENKPTILMLVPLYIETFYKSIMKDVRSEGKEKKLRRAMTISNLLLKLGIDKRKQFFKDILEPFGGNLRWIISGGAPLEPFYVKAFRALGIEILNGYGTTECSPCVSVNRNYFYKDGSVGKLIPGMEARIAPDGEVELHGLVVMLGYYGNQEATKEVLSEDGWYKTGDLGYVDSDQFIFLTGRKKNLIILSNGEIESPEGLEANFQIDEGVSEVLVYEWDNKIVAEIYPEESYKGNTEYFQQLMNKVNEGRALSKQVASVKLRNEEFVKNSAGKIIRNKNIPRQK